MRTAMVILVSGAVALFGVTSAMLGFIAEAKTAVAVLSPDETHVSGRECVYLANPFHTLVFCAIFLLLVAEVIASAAGSCCGCCRPPGGASSKSTRRQRVGVVASVLSWLVGVLAVVYYWVGAALNTTVTRRASGPDEECYLIKGGIFARAAVFSLVATALGIMSCVLLRLPRASDALPEQGQHAVGLPQWPTTQGHRQERAYPCPAQGYGQASDPKLAPPAQGQEHGQVIKCT